MLQIEHDYQGRDYSINLKAMNPSPVDLTGMYIGNILQSVTKHLALGVEGLYQRPQPDLSDLALSYLIKYTGGENPTLPWIGTAQLSPTQGLLQTTYWHKLSEKLEVAADLQLIANSQRRDAIATLGARWDLRMATFRAQLDSTGKVSALLEQRFAPSFSFLVAGEIDHFRVRTMIGRVFCYDSCADSCVEIERCKGRRWCDDRELVAHPRGDEHGGDAAPSAVVDRSTIPAIYSARHCRLNAYTPLDPCCRLLFECYVALSVRYARMMTSLPRHE